MQIRGVGEAGALQLLDPATGLVEGEHRRQEAVLLVRDLLGAPGRPLDVPPDRAVADLQLVDPRGGGRLQSLAGPHVGGVLPVDRHRIGGGIAGRSEGLGVRVGPVPAVAADDVDAGRKQLDPVRGLAVLGQVQRDQAEARLVGGGGRIEGDGQGGRGAGERRHGRNVEVGREASHPEEFQGRGGQIAGRASARRVPRAANG